jgi:hypothetical protein
MQFRFIYCQEYNRVFSGVYIDSQYNIPAIANKIGSEIKQWVDAKLALISENVLPYKIETEKGVLAGIVSLEVDSSNAVANVQQKQYRPAYVQFSTQLDQAINDFISSNDWQDDLLM